jgi:hypothetical protein
METSKNSTLKKITLTNLLDIIRKNPLTVIALIIMFLFTTWIYGMCSRVPSVSDPNMKLNRQELQVEYDHIIAQYKLKFTDLDNKDAVKKIILDQAVLFSQTGTFNPLGAVNLLVSIGAIGSALDSRRKLKVANGKTKNVSTG